MKVKILCITMVSLIWASGLSAQVLWLNGGGGGIADWCLIGSPTASSDTSDNTCYWCETGERSSGYCTSRYASCAGGSDMVVASGGIMTDTSNNAKWRCTDDGWVSYTETETCYSGAGCKETCYWDAGPYTCLSCPAPDFVSLLPVFAHTGQDGVRSDIADCFISRGIGFSDVTGTFDILGDCYYSL